MNEPNNISADEDNEEDGPLTFFILEFTSFKHDASLTWASYNYRCYGEQQ